MSDLRDNRDGVYDPINEQGKPPPDQVPLKPTAHEAAQWGADVRPDPVLTENKTPDLPEGLRRERKGPVNKVNGLGNDR
jgi:hypothetical protein